MFICFFNDIYLIVFFVCPSDPRKCGWPPASARCPANPETRPHPATKRKECQGSPVIGMKKKLAGTTHHMMTHGVSACWVVLSYRYAMLRQLWCCWETSLVHSCWTSVHLIASAHFWKPTFHVLCHYVLPSIAHWWSMMSKHYQPWCLVSLSIVVAVIHFITHCLLLCLEHCCEQRFSTREVGSCRSMSDGMTGARHWNDRLNRTPISQCWGPQGISR